MISANFAKPDEKVSERMKQVRSSNTSIEIEVRKALYRLGYRFRLHIKSLPGTPDIVLKKHRTAIFVHGCFWHGHEKCAKGQRLPVKNFSFWQDKIKKNKARDEKTRTVLTKLGWRVLVIWECEVPKVRTIMTDFLKL
jgi:DNA mismatch endonuclease (patch repair protein)